MHPNQNLAVLRIFKFQAVFAPFGGEIGQVIHFRRAAIVSVRQARRRFRRQRLLKASKYEALSADAIRIANPIANVVFYNNHLDYRINRRGRSKAIS
jgi:hypothetical protein